MSDVINAFPGYEYVQFEDGTWHNMYRGTDVGRGGYVYAEPGIYRNVALLDVRNMHGESIVRLNKFGEHTKRYIEIREARNAIKARDFETASKLLDGKLAPYLTDDASADQLSDALKLICNSTYGIAAATFENPLKDPRDVNNIIALRGALFMRTLQDEIIEQGFRGIHYKTDSVKIPNATPEIIKFVMEFGEKYGYEFEHEATYDRMCLVNDSVYIAKYDDYGIRNKGGKHAGEWTATGAQFQQPIVFKTLFSGEPISFDDYCETKSVSGDSNIYLDMNENLRSQEDAEEERDRRRYNASHPDKIKKLNPGFIDISDDELDEIIASAHDYQFIGRVGLFFPIKPGRGGGELFREKDGKYYAVTGTKGYRWLEAETVKLLGKEEDLDPEYHNHLVEEAIAAINNYGDFDKFVGRRTIDIQSTDPVVPCGDGKYNTCLECPACEGDICNSGYSLAVNDMKGGDDR